MNKDLEEENERLREDVEYLECRLSEYESRFKIIEDVIKIEKESLDPFSDKILSYFSRKADGADLASAAEALYVTEDNLVRFVEQLAQMKYMHKKSDRIYKTTRYGKDYITQKNKTHI